jgi:hypothetical protein
MFKNLMHALVGHPAQNAAQGSYGNTMSTAQLGNAISNSVLMTGGNGSYIPVQAKQTRSKKIFSGNIEVSQVANGYVVNIATREGYEYETHIAQTITEVNEIIAAAMVAFQLEK